MSAYASKAFAGVAREEIVVALSHHPEFFAIAAASGAQLTLASHTHGGQVSLFAGHLSRHTTTFTARLKTAARLSTSPPGQVTGCLFGSLRRGRSSSSPFGKGDSGASVEPCPWRINNGGHQSASLLFLVAFGMRDLILLVVHVLATSIRLARPGGVRSVLAESVLLKHQLLILNRSRRRAPNLRVSDRMIAGLCALLVLPRRLVRSAASPRHR